MKPTKTPNALLAVACLAALACSCCIAPSRAAEASAGGGYVSRADYEKLRQETAEMKKTMLQMQEQMTAMSRMQGSILSSVASGPQSSSGKETVSASQQGAIAELQTQVDELKHQVHETFPGSTKFLLAGYGAAGFTAQHGHDPFFSASLNPIFLWKLSDRLLFEGELELELEDGETHLGLEYAQTSYLLNDYMTIGAGKFLNPTNFFVQHQHPAWINKLPDKPLAVYDGLMPESMLGVQIRGAIPIGSTTLEYAVFAANAPQLVTSGDPSEIGTLSFDNFDNADGHISYGGHVGFLPIPQVEIGYGIQHSGVGPRGDTVNANLQSVDLNIVDDSELLKGLINFRIQWVWSQVGSFTYDADSSQGFGPITFSNHRNGGYAQLSYRPSRVDNFLKDFEPVVRFDDLTQRNTPDGFDEKRWTFGLNYWLTPSTVVKVAYEVDSKSGGNPKENAIMVQVATGF